MERCGVFLLNGVFTEREEDDLGTIWQVRRDVEDQPTILCSSDVLAHAFHLANLSPVRQIEFGDPPQSFMLVSNGEVIASVRFGLLIS